MDDKTAYLLCIDALVDAVEAVDNPHYADDLISAMAAFIAYPDEPLAAHYMLSGFVSLKDRPVSGDFDPYETAYIALIGFCLESPPGSPMEVTLSARIPRFFNELDEQKKVIALAGLAELVEDEEFKGRPTLAVLKELLQAATKPAQRPPSRPGLTP